MAGYKKANAGLDLIVILVFIVGTIFGLFIIGNSMNPLFESLKDQPELVNESREILSDRYENTPTTYDNMVVIILLALYVFTMYSASQIDTKPALFVVSFLIVGLVFFIAFLISGGITGIFESSGFVSFTERMPMTGYFLNHLGQAAIIMGASMAVVLFAKKKIAGDF
jgi:hypothetical protein